MAEEKKAPESSDEARRSFFEIARKLVLASIGVVAVAQEEIDAFVQRLIERGEIAEQDGRRLLEDVRSRRSDAAEKAQEEGREQRRKVQETVDRGIDDILDRMNVPSKSEVDALNKKIALLAEKIDELQKHSDAA